MARESLKNICRLIDSAQQRIPPEVDFLGDLKRSIERDDAKESRAPSMTYKPSSMNCIRNMYYQVTGTPQDEDYKPYTLVGICNSGSDIHERVQKAVSRMKDNGFDCEYVNVADYIRERPELLAEIEIVSQQGMETKLYHRTLNMSFLCDGIIKYKGEYYILELKTESSSKFNMRKGVDPKHYKQGTAYSTALKIPKVLFVYISRDVLDMKSFMFRPTDDMRDEFLSNIRECDEWVEKKTPPPKPDNVIKSVCEYCSYRSTCRVDA